MGITIQKSVASPKVEIPDGPHIAQCIAVEEKYLEEDQYGNHDKVVLKMQFPDFTDDEGEFAVVEAMVNKKFNEKSTLFTYARALGLSPEQLDSLDCDHLIGKSALCDILNEESSKGGVWPRIKNMMALPKGMGGTTQQRPPPVIAPDGSVNYTVFWQVLKDNNVHDKGALANVLNLDMKALAEKLAGLDGVDAMTLIDEVLIQLDKDSDDSDAAPAQGEENEG